LRESPLRMELHKFIQTHWHRWPVLPMPRPFRHPSLRRWVGRPTHQTQQSSTRLLRHQLQGSRRLSAFRWQRPNPIQPRKQRKKLIFPRDGDHTRRRRREAAVAQDRRRVHRAARSVGKGDLISARVRRASSSLRCPHARRGCPRLGWGLRWSRHWFGVLAHLWTSDPVQFHRSTARRPTRPEPALVRWPESDHRALTRLMDVSMHNGRPTSRQRRE
jgi:hypothetical protein